MSKVWNLIRELYQDERGAALVEYTVLLGMLIVAVLATIMAVGGWIGSEWTTFNGLVNP